MAITYEPIATTTLSTAAANVTFSSISGSYTDLVLVANIKGSTSSAYVSSEFNGDTASNYSQTTLYGNGTTPGSSRNNNQTRGHLAQNGNINATDFTPYIFNYNNYSNTTTYKNWLGRCGSASFEVEAVVGLWRSTSAITSIKYFLNTGNIATGSTFTLYGIKAA